MIKPIIISEEETNRILNLHNKTERTFISEQRQYYRGSDLKVGYVDGPRRLPDGATAISKEEYEKAQSSVPSLIPSFLTTTSQPTKDPKFDYFRFGSFGEIPVLKGTKLYYSDGLINGRTKKILGIEKSDKFGAYDEVYVEGWDTKVKRYYPTNGWDDWDFIYDNNIPYAFENENGLFSLVLILVDPVKSVIDLGDPISSQIITGDNQSRGWVLSGMGYQSDKEGDSATGYFKLVNGEHVAYNITAPLIRGDQSTFHLDTRSDFDRFMDSNWGMAAQIAIQIAITVLLRNQIAMSLPARLFATEAAATATVLQKQMATRLIIATTITEAFVNIPIALYYRQRGPEYENMMWISLLFCALPLIQGKFLSSLISDFSPATCMGLARKMMERSIRNTASGAELKALYQSLSWAEKELFFQVMTNVKTLTKMGIEEQIAKAISTLFEGGKQKLLTKETAFWFAREEILMLMKQQPKFIKGLLVDVGTTLAYAKTIGKILETWSSSKEKKGELVDNLSEEEKKKVKENTIKLNKQLDNLPSFLKQNFKKQEWITYPWSVTEEDFIWMINNGILSDKFKQQIYMFPVRNFDDCKDLYQHFNEKDLVALTDQLMSLKEVTESPDFKNVLTNEQRKIWKLFYKCIYKKTEEKDKKGTQPSLTSSTETTEFTSTTIDTQYDWIEADQDTTFAYSRDPRYEMKTEPYTINNIRKYKYFYRPKISGRQDQGVEIVQGDKSAEVKNLPPSNLEKLSP